MRREVIDCDRCGKQGVAAQTIVVTVDRRMDGAGSREDVCEHVDLCPACLRTAIYELLPRQDYDAAKKFIAANRRMGK